MMDYTKATKNQLWTILKSDSDCSLPLLEGAFTEALQRGLLKQFIISVMKKKRLHLDKPKHLLGMSHEDFIQLGYEAGFIALKKFKPGKAAFLSFMYLCVSQAYDQQFQRIETGKRKGEEVSYNKTISDENTMEYYYLVDHQTNVEKTVINKIRLEEKINLLNPTQRETFLMYFSGYSYSEIAEKTNVKKTAIRERMRAAFIKMTGHSVNLLKLGIFERTSFKKQGA
jgi:RNA polymerase sigma factor (sigma-70 family)